MKEIDVAKPVEKFLLELGYLVRSEVKGCDITASKNDELLVVECKTNISLKLIYQAIDRQEFSDSVYIAIPQYSGKKVPNRKHLLRLLKRLEIGLIVVQILKTKTRVEVIVDPRAYKRAKKNKKRVSIIEEINNRSENYNVGGTKGKIMTAYKESAINIARILKDKGPMTAKELKVYGTGDKTYSILYKNFYGWFVKDSQRGAYRISVKGEEFLNSFKDSSSC